MNQPRRAAASSQFRSPFENILNMFQISGIPQGHEKPLKHAFYNAAAMFLLLLSCVAAYGLFLILQPFFKPLLWALLVGSVLYPAKRELSKQIKIWFTNLEETNTSIIVGVVKLPITFIDYLSDMLGKWLCQHAKLLVSLIVALPLLHCLYNYTPISFICILWKCVMLSDVLFTWIIGVFNTKIVFAFAVCYIISILFLWSPNRLKLFTRFSIMAWFIVSAYLSNIFGVFQVPIFLIIQVAAISGFFLKESLPASDDLSSENTENIAEDKIVTTELLGETPEQTSSPNQEAGGDKVIKTPMVKAEKKLEITLVFNTLLKFKSPLIYRSNSVENISTVLDSDIYFRYLFYACGFLLLWKQLWVLPLLPIPVIVFLSKKLWYFFGMHNKACVYIQDVRKFFEERKEVIISMPVEGILVILKKIHKKAVDFAMDSVDNVSSAVVILVLLLSLSSAFLFISIQIYAEVIQMVQMGSSVVNKTILHNPELLGLLPPEVEESIDNILENAYQYGRDGISKVVNSFLHDADSVQAQRLESQLLTLWDRAYQSWMDNPNSMNPGPRVTEDAVKQSFDSFMEDLYKSPELLNFAGITNWAKQNVGTLTGVLESAWSLLRGNLELLLGIITAVIQLFLGSSTAVITWLLNSIVFLTTLFYLLASSDKKYRPVEALSAMAGGAKVVNRISCALEEAVAGVFLASLKMSLFYWLWTWLIHNIFGTSIVYLPSVIASMLAVVPFLGTYWVCIVGALDLWCVQDRFWSAMGLVLFQFAPTTLLDATLYNEIKGGGHPYLTGLSVAGGLWCLGPEGALLGPLLLCLLVVVTDLSSAALRDSPVNQPQNRRLPRLE